MINIDLVDCRAEAQEQLQMAQTFTENECDQQPQEYMATNSYSAYQMPEMNDAQLLAKAIPINMPPSNMNL